MNVPWRELSVVVLGPLVVLALALGLWRSADAAVTRAEMAQGRLAHALARPIQSPEAEAQAALVPGETAGLAASALQALVLAAVQPSGAEVVELAAGAVDPAAPLTRLHMTLQLKASEAELVAALVALEGAVPLIVVDRLDAQGAGQGPGQDPTLAATLALSAWAGKVTP